MVSLCVLRELYNWTISVLCDPPPRHRRIESADIADSMAYIPAMLDGVRVLLVEDHDDQRELLGEVLSTKGAIVRDVPSGEAAVALARTWPPDVVLIDLDLPGIDGVEALTEIRKIDQLASCPGVVLSGHGGEQDRSRSLAAGFGKHLVKPAAVADIISAVASVASRAVPLRSPARSPRA